ncbi:MAG: tyrosine-type recombinase/integrase [bacterium]|nr:tyrosine-type recombinase/integrase [bacterium]MDE0502124.1 tyrosine-type recombinase/integrase [bacterium]
MSQKRPKTLSAAFVRTVNQPGRYGDGRGSHGLSLLVSRRTNGRLSKRWTQRVRIDGRETNLGLGVYPVVTLAEARQKALGNRRSIEQGRNPKAPAVPTFSEATERVIELHSGKWKAGGRSADIWRSSLERFAGPVGDIRVDKVTTSQVLSVLAPIWHVKGETARKVRQRISAVMRWAIAQGYREDNPADERVVAALGRNTKPPTHHNALHYSQVRNAIETIETSGAYWAAQAALRFLVLTAARSGEVRNATWEEINTQQETWSIPAERTKTGRPHRVPLSGAARAILEDAHSRTGGRGLVFPSIRGKVQSSDGLAKLLKENNIDCVPHGFRSSFRNWCAESGVSREVAERALGHAVRNRAEAAYSRTDLLGRRRRLMQQWADYIT